MDTILCTVPNGKLWRRMGSGINREVERCRKDFLDAGDLESLRQFDEDLSAIARRVYRLQ